jgi:hypothetical protein
MRYGVSSRGIMDSCNNRHFRSSDVTVRLTTLCLQRATWDRQGASKSVYSHAYPGLKYDYTLRPQRFTRHPTLHIPTPSHTLFAGLKYDYTLRPQRFTRHPTLHIPTPSHTLFACSSHTTTCPHHSILSSPYPYIPTLLGPCTSHHCIP